LIEQNKVNRLDENQVKLRNLLRDSWTALSPFVPWLFVLGK